MFRLTNDIRCLGCGYCLKGLQSSRCPECGKTFDRNDPRTFVYRVLCGKSLLLNSLFVMLLLVCTVLGTGAVLHLKLLIDLAGELGGFIGMVVLLFLWCGLPALAWLLARDRVREARPAMKSRAMPIERPVLARIGYVLLLLVARGPLILILLIAGIPLAILVIRSMR